MTMFHRTVLTWAAVLLFVAPGIARAADEEPSGNLSLGTFWIGIEEDVHLFGQILLHPTAGPFVAQAMLADDEGELIEPITIGGVWNESSVGLFYGGGWVYFRVYPVDGDTLGLYVQPRGYAGNERSPVPAMLAILNQTAQLGGAVADWMPESVVSIDTVAYSLSLIPPPDPLEENWQFENEICVPPKIAPGVSVTTVQIIGEKFSLEIVRFPDGTVNLFARKKDRNGCWIQIGNLPIICEICEPFRPHVSQPDQVPNMPAPPFEPPPPPPPGP